MTTETKRTQFAYWRQKAEAAGWGEQSELKALTMMAVRGIPVLADDCDAILGLSPGTTLFMNHGGSVPAEEVERQLSLATGGKEGA